LNPDYPRIVIAAAACSVLAACSGDGAEAPPATTEPDAEAVDVAKDVSPEDAAHFPDGVPSHSYDAADSSEDGLVVQDGLPAPDIYVPDGETDDGPYVADGLPVDGAWTPDGADPDTGQD